MANSLNDVPTIPADPVDLHAVLREARNAGPLARNHLGMVLALRARHLDTVVSSLTRQLETEVLQMQGVTEGPIYENMTNMLLWANGEAHARRRRVMTRAFSFKLMEAMRPRARLVAEKLIQERIGAGPINFLQEVAGQIPAQIISEILGIPESDLPYFRKLVEDTGKTIFIFPQDERPFLESRVREFFEYADSLIAERRRNPREDFLSKFAVQGDENDSLSDAELRSNLIGLIIAGSDTTKNSIAITSALLIDHPEQWKKLVSDPERWKKPVAQEGFRYEPVALGVPRIATTNFDLDGFLVEPGTVLLFSIVSANRDPEVFGEADKFDISRADHPRRTIGFGHGAHACMGQALAWVELEETLAALARFAPKARRTGPVPRMGSAGTRLVDQLELSLA